MRIQVWETVILRWVLALNPMTTMYLAVRHYMANQRQGTPQAKERGEVSGSTHSFSARRYWRGKTLVVSRSRYFVVGVSIDSSSRSYSFKLNKKLMRLARRSALTYKAQGRKCLLLRILTEAPKTKVFAEIV